MAEGALVQVWTPPTRFDDFGPGTSRSNLSTWRFRQSLHSSLASLISEQTLWSDQAMLARSNDALGSTCEYVNWPALLSFNQHIEA